MTSPRAGRQFPAEVLTPEEVSALLSKCSMRAPTGIRNRALITLLYRSGLRISEVLALKPSDVNMKAHSIRVLDTKTGTAQTRGFHPSAADALARWIDKRKELGLNHNGNKLFCTLDGSPVYAQYVRLMLQRLAVKSGIEKAVRPHGLRHTYAVELEQAGVPVTVISKLLGHSSIAITSRYLDHLTNGHAVSVLEATELPELS